MDSYNNLDPSLIHTNDFFTPLNDAQTHDQTHPEAQLPDRFMQPPGAESLGPPTSTRFRQAEYPVSSPLSPSYPGIEGGTSWMPTPFSMNSQSNSSVASFDARSLPDSNPPLSHVFDLRPPISCEL